MLAFVAFCPPPLWVQVYMMVLNSFQFHNRVFLLETDLWNRWLSEKQTCLLYISPSLNLIKNKKKTQRKDMWMKIWSLLWSNTTGLTSNTTGLTSMPFGKADIPAFVLLPCVLERWGQRAGFNVVSSLLDYMLPQVPFSIGCSFCLIENKYCNYCRKKSHGSSISLKNGSQRKHD